LGLVYAEREEIGVEKALRIIQSLERNKQGLAFDTVGGGVEE